MKAKELLINWGLALIPVTIVFSGRLNGMLIAAFSLLAIIIIVKSKPKFDKTIFVQAAFFFIICYASLVDLFYNYFDIHYIERGLSALLIPVILFGLRRYYSTIDILKNSVLLITTINASLIVIGLYNALASDEIVYGNWSYEVTKEFYANSSGVINWGMLTYSQLISYLNIHPTYYGMLVLLVLVCVIFLKKEKVLNQLFAISIVLVNAIFIVLLSSKANILAMILVSIILALVSFPGLTRNKKISVTIFTLLITAMVFIVPSTRLRINRSIETLTSKKSTSGQEDTKDSSTSERVVLWSTAIELIKGKFLFGHGVSNGNTLVKERSEINKNTHNQYLQVFVNAGIIGFLALLFYLIAPFFYSGSDRLLWSGIIAVVSINLLFENILDRQYGIVIATFFYSILYNFKKMNHGKV